MAKEILRGITRLVKLVKIVLEILQNKASVSEWGRGRVHKILQFMNCSAKI